MMYFKPRHFQHLVFALIVMTGAATAALANDIIKDWNITAATLVVPSGPPVHQTRLMAIHQIAVHDAVNGITRRYKTYMPRVDAPNEASPEAAAIAASYYTLCGLFPAQCGPLYPTFVNSLAANGLAFGRSWNTLRRCRRPGDPRCAG